MEKKKVYIFFTCPIAEVGGIQMYTAGKAKYLESLGWKVLFFTADSKKEKSDIPSLTKYLRSGYGCYFLAFPPYRLTLNEQEKCLNFLLKRLNLSDDEQYEILIESHEEKWAYWAELFAEKIGAQHFFVSCNEIFRPTPYHLKKTYEYDLDFFYFKWKRNELISTANILKRIFNGYGNVTELLMERPERLIVEMHPIQDVDFPQIEKISRLDWNICHIGRAKKRYVPYLIKGVRELARRYPDKKINFIMVGNADFLKDLLEKTLADVPNVTLTLLGDMIPIPKILFSKVDVVCAISQTARFTADAGILTICANADVPEKTPGVLGYDTNKAVHNSPTSSYIEALENVLVKRLYDDKKYALEKLLPPEHYYEKFWSVIKQASKTKEYYTERLSQDRIRKWFSPFPFASIARGTKIILVGNTEIAVDYRMQILCQQFCTVEISPDGVKQLDEKPYCEILATIDEHPENFDDSVVGFERLKQLDYDAIILTAYTSDVERLRKKILEIVPQMADRIICNAQFLDIYQMQHKKTRLFEE